MSKPRLGPLILSYASLRLFKPCALSTRAPQIPETTALTATSLTTKRLEYYQAAPIPAATMVPDLPNGQNLVILLRKHDIPPFQRCRIQTPRENQFSDRSLIFFEPDGFLPFADFGCKIILALMRRLYLKPLLILVLGFAACQPSAIAPTTPTAIPFPTVTHGYTLHGLLSTQQGALSSVVSNPATVEAIANLPTATPNTGSCPTLSPDIELISLPDTTDGISNEIVRFLSAGGSAVALEEALREDWGVLGEGGFIRSDFDFTGDGTPEVIIGFVVPLTGGALLIAGCQEGRYQLHYESVSNQEVPPELILLGDANHDGLHDIVFAHQKCDDRGECVYQTNLITWQSDLWRFVGLLGDNIESDLLPEMTDVDDDEVSEIVVRMERFGSLATGPLRTGVNIYDWNGTLYVLSIIQLDPPRYRIQFIHAADRQFAAGNVSEAISLYQRILSDESLRTWLDDEIPILDSYTLFRMLVARTFSGDSQSEEVIQYILENYPDPEQTPVYVEMSRIFWDTFQVSNDLTSACRAVQDMIDDRPEAVNLMNRYGSRNPTYTAEAFCSF